MHPITNTAPAWTPGPWELDYDKGSSQDILSRKHGGICTVRRAGRHDNATFAANARLISTVPELAASLAKMTSWAGMYAQSHGINTETGDGPLSADLRQARAILTRIHGQ